jgi:chromosome segregation ATPase
MNLEERIEQLEKQKKILQDSIRKFKKRTEEAEGEVTLIKGIGMNSPEMRMAQARIKELEEINKSHQKLNGELRADNKRLAKQVGDQVDRFRKSGGL